jgi:hypothetical protein
MERSLRLRFALLALLLLQLTLPGWSAVADGHFVRAQLQSDHLESEPCTPPHPDDCALCTFLQTPADVPAPLSVVPSLTALHVDAPAERRSQPIGAIAAAPLARGPPAQS